MHLVLGYQHPPTLTRREIGLRYRTYRCGTGILTCFPFDNYQLGVALGPAHPRLKNIAVKPLPFRRRGFSPLFAITAAGICTSGRSSGSHDPPSALPERLPTK